MNVGVWGCPKAVGLKNVRPHCAILLAERLPEIRCSFSFLTMRPKNFVMILSE